MNTRNIPSLLALLPLLLLPAGCLLDYAPSAPSRSINTWLLGVWEAQGEDGSTLRAVVAPVESDRMTIFFTEKDRKGKTVRSGTYPAWLSRVGQAWYLVLQAREEPAPGFLVLGYQFLDPLQLRVREITLDPDKPCTSSFQLRVQMRRQFARGDLFGGRQLLWQKTGEVYWAKEGDPAEDTFKPPRNLPVLHDWRNDSGGDLP